MDYLVGGLLADGDLRPELDAGALLMASFLFIRASDDYFEISKNLDIFASLYREC